MTLYVAKDPSLSQPVGPSRSSHADHHRAPQVLPYGNTSKETWFLSELEDLMELLKPEDIVPYREPLFKRIAKCIASTNILVGTGSLCHVDRGKDALSVEQPGVLHPSPSKTRRTVRAILPLLFKSLFGGLHSTSDTIQAMSANILNLYQELDSGLYQKLLKEMNDSGKWSR